MLGLYRSPRGAVNGGDNGVHLPPFFVAAEAEAAADDGTMVAGSGKEADGRAADTSHLCFDVPCDVLRVLSPLPW
jgi:hypothetical protein